MSTSVQNSPSRYQPTGDDHLLYHWVKMQGKTQEEVASLFNINQSTVSRIIQRYERWQAHAKSRENGRLTPAERLRTQRIQTFERNELILASCLRIAKDVEGCMDAAKSTLVRPFSSPSQEREVRTQHYAIDRTGMAARFLRLAFRINMEQLQLANLFAREGEAPAEPLSDEELAREAAEAAADAAEIAAARQKARADAEWLRGTEEPEADAPAEPTSAPLGATAGSSSSASDLAQPAMTLSPSLPPSVPLSPSPLHNLHNENSQEIAATAVSACTCTPNSMTEKKSSCSCIINLAPDRPIELIQLQTPQSLPKVAPTAADSPTAAAT